MPVPHIIRLDSEETWPADLLDYLELKRELFLAWELHRMGMTAACVSPSEYDSATYGLRHVLSSHVLHGYHCTRITDSEIENILLNGMRRPDQSMLRERIEILQ